MGERYPYPNPESNSKLFYQPTPFRINTEKSWTSEGFDLKTELEKAGGPVIEVAGPTHDGYIPLGEEAILPEEPIFTNGQLGLDHIDRKLDMVVDGSHMPFPDNSIGVLLVSCLSIIDESGINESQGFLKSLDYSTDEAYQEYQDYAGPGTAKVNLRIATLEEAARVLKPGGVLVWEGVMDGDSEAAALNGLKAKERIVGKYDNDPTAGLHFEDSERVIIFQKL